MRYIDDYTVVADSSADLQTAVSTGNIYNYIYLGTNITLANGMTIDPAKTTLTIDGTYEGVTHTLTDINSNSENQTLGIRTTSNIQLTLQHMVIHGLNYYGVPYVVGETLFIDNRNVSVTYRDVVYDGPQIAYNPDGLVRFIDCDITIHQTGSDESQEVAEANRVEFGGTVRIQHESTNSTRAVLYYRGNTGTMALTVLENADVTINSVNNYFLYNSVLLTEPHVTSCTFQQGSRFDLTTNKGFSYFNTHRVSSFTVEENAAFLYTQRSENGTYASMYVNGDFTVGSGAQVMMRANYAGAQPLINFLATTNPITINNPKSFVVYNSAGPALSFAATAGTPKPFTLSGGQINYWNAAGTGGLDDTPLYKWAKADWGSFSVWGNVQPGNTAVAGSTLAPEEITNPLNLLQLQTARVLSIGDIQIAAETILDNGTPITGTTDPAANVRAVYTVQGVSHTLNTIADESGVYTLSTAGETPAAIPGGTQVTLWANIPYLTVWITETAEGSLTLISAPTRIRFNTPALTIGGDTFLQRYFPDGDEQVIVDDTRVESTDWTLSLAITGDLETIDGYTLPGALIFMREDETWVQLSTAPTLVATGEAKPEAEEVKRTVFQWPAARGMLLRLSTPIQSGKEYVTYAVWEVLPVETP